MSISTLPLDSERWDTLDSSVGGNGRFTAQLLTSVVNGEFSGLDELSHQICHQLSVGSVAYAAVPHLVIIASNIPTSVRIQVLAIIGLVVASQHVFSTDASVIPEDLQENFGRAIPQTLSLALRTIENDTIGHGEITTLLGVVASIKRQHNLALHLLLHGGSDHELSCPQCGEYISWK